MVARLLDSQVEPVGEPVAMMVDQVLDVLPRPDPALLEMQQLASRFLGVYEGRREAEQLLGREQHSTGGNEHSPLQQTAPRRSAALVHGLQ